MLEAMEGYVHRRIALSASRSPFVAPVSIAARLPRVSRAAANADLLQVHGDMASLLAVPLLMLRPAVLTTQGLHLLRRTGGVRRKAVERGLEAAVRRSAAVLCSSNDEFGELSSFLSASARRRLMVVPSGVPIPPAADPANRAATRRALGLGDETLAVLFLGQLEERKDPLTAVESVREIGRRGVDAVLLVAGEGPLESRLQELEGPDLRLLGFRRDAPSLLDAADVFVMPSAREGLSFALLEAMSHGLPPVVADGPGNAEGVADAGLVFPFGDAAALADALERLARDPGERARLGAAARTRVETEYGAERLRRGVELGYRAALSEPRG